MKTFIKIGLILILTFVLALSGFLAYMFIITKDVKLDGDKLKLTTAAAAFYDNDGNLFEDMPLSDKKAVAYEEIPEHTKNAFIAVEDKHFFNHSGLDYKRIVKAGLKNLSGLSYKQGASTISQQLIKNTHLSFEKTLKRKFTEIKLTRQLEKKYTKQQIMGLYLNSIYFGENSFGITKACEVYFDKLPAELEVSESAMLAAVIKAPSKYSPFKDEQKCKNRRDFVLKLMLEQGYLTENEYAAALKSPIPKDKHINAVNSYIKAAHNQVQELTDISPYALATGYKVYTYMQPGIQTHIESIKINEIASYHKSNIVIDNKSGAVIAYSSDAGNILRSPGSALKPLLVYAPAIENNIISPAVPIEDAAQDFGGYQPKNFGGTYHGYISAKQALSKSLNIPAVKILSYTGIDKSISYLTKLNINLSESDYNLAAALGGLTYGTGFIELAGAYNAFANAGEFYKPAFIKKVTDNKGNVLYEHNPKGVKVYSESTAFLINDMLKEAVISGSAKNLKPVNFDLAAKTGTAGSENGNTDAYCISYTSAHTVASWAGAAEGELMPNNITGGTYTTLNAKRILERLYCNTKPAGFFTSSEVEQINLDKISYEEEHILEIADANSPEQYIIKEYFKKDNIPYPISRRFSEPKIESAEISVANGEVCIVLCLKEYYEYAVFCKFEGKNILIYDSLNSERKQTVLHRPEKDGSYFYSVIPYVVIGDKKIEGEIYSFPQVKLNVKDSLKPHDERDDIIKDKDDWWDD